VIVVLTSALWRFDLMLVLVRLNKEYTVINVSKILTSIISM
jgi:hypothetical protein